MILVLKPHTSAEDNARVESLVKNKGLTPHMVVGNEMTIIGCVGDTSKVDPRLFEVDPSVERVMHVQEPYKLANRAFHPENSIIDVSGVKIGGDHLGPVSYTHLDVYKRQIQRRGINIAHDLSVQLCCQIRIFFQCVANSLSEFLHGRHMTLISDRRVFHIIPIYLHQFFCICFTDRTYLKFHPKHPFPEIFFSNILHLR